MPESAAEYYRISSRCNGVQYFRIGEIRPSRQEAEENKRRSRRDTEIIEGPEDSLQAILGEGDIFELRGLLIPGEEPIDAN